MEYPMSVFSPGDDPRPRGFFESSLAGWINVGAMGVGSLSLICVIPLWLLTFLPGSHSIGSAEFVPFVILIFPLWFWAIITMNSRSGWSGFAAASWRRRRKFSWRSALGELPRWARGTALGLAIVGWLGIVTSFSGLSGQPSYDPTRRRYELDDHGSITVVSKGAYVHAVALQNRLFLGAAIAFTAVAVAVAANEWVRRRRA
jgi:hypothetical protein